MFVDVCVEVKLILRKRNIVWAYPSEYMKDKGLLH
jgi:hypothetical protein